MVGGKQHGASMRGARRALAKAREGALGVVRTIFSFEAAFLAFVFAGNYKGAAGLAGFPIDMTLLWFCVSLVLGAVIILRHWPLSSRTLRFGLAGVAFCLFPSVSLAWSPGQIYARQKAIYVATLTLWSFLGAAWVIGRDQERVRRFAKLLGLSGIGLAAVVFVKHLGIGLAEPGQFRVFGANYLMNGRLVGFGAVNMAAAFWAGRDAVPRCLVGLALGFALAMVVDIGSKGPIIGSYLAATLPVVVGFKSAGVAQVRSMKGFKVSCLIVALAIAALFAFRAGFGVLPTGVDRLLRLPAVIRGETSDVRSRLMVGAIQGWLDSPIWGHGCGSFPLIYGVGDAKLHPHNLLLEVLVELGLVGAGLLFWLVALAVFPVLLYKRIVSSPAAIWLAMLLVFIGVNVMVSGDLHENRALFMVLGLFPCGDIRRDGVVVK